MQVATSGKWDARYLGPVPHDLSYYSKCMLGGLLACGLTHAALTPLDMAKTNMQVNPKKYTGLFSGIRLTVKEEGASRAWKGWAPTLIGYSLQGTFKYGLYEVFKDLYMNMAGEEAAEKYKPAIWLAGSASAELFADIALCPLEMTRVKVQTSPTGTFPIAIVPALREMHRTKVETRFPFGSIVPLWGRQLPYTMAKFFFFEGIVSQFYTHVFTEPKSSYGTGTQLGITFTSGYLAGIVCAVVSHPADSMVSLLGKAENKGKSMGAIAGKVGFATLATKGLGARMIMIGTLTGFQWWIYDTCKTVMGLGTTGGK